MLSPAAAATAARWRSCWCGGKWLNIAAQQRNIAVFTETGMNTCHYRLAAGAWRGLGAVPAGKTVTLRLCAPLAGRKDIRKLGLR